MYIRSTLLLAGLCLVGLYARSVQAQEIFNAIQVPAASEVSAAQAAVPDTTTPWRYFPLQVGNVWEYQDYEGYILRMAVIRDTTFHERRYFKLDHTDYEPEPNRARRLRIGIYLRYDTTGQRVRENHPSFMEGEFGYFYAPCPFGSAFGEMVDCTPQGWWYAGGRYDGMLVFGGERPGEGRDTLRAPVKTFVAIGIEYRFVADFGLVYHEVEGHGWGLVYARIGGKEYGKRRITVASEPEDPVAQELRIKRIYPNPVRARLRLDYTAAIADPLTMSLYDVLGRRVAAQDVPSGASGTVSSDVSALAPGVYFARLCNANTCVSHPVTKVF